MPKKLFSWKSSSKKSDKIVTDAVKLVDETDASRNVSSEVTQRNSLSIAPVSPEIGFVRNFDNQNMSVTRTNGLMMEPSNTLSVSNNTQQNIYQFSGINGLHIGTSVRISNSVESSTERRSKTSVAIPKTRSIDDMMKSNESVNEKVMDVISTHLGMDWRFLFRNLGYSDGQIDQVTLDYPGDVKEQIYRLLLDYSRNSDDASIGHITKILWKNGFKECVNILKIHWKNGELTDVSSGSEGKSEEAPGCSTKSVD